MSDPRYVTIYSPGRERRLEIRERGAYLVLTLQGKALVSTESEWLQEGSEFAIPIEGSTNIGDVAASLVVLWEERRQAEMAVRAAKAKAL